MAKLSLIVGSTEIDLLAGGDGYTLRLDGWQPQVASRSDNKRYENVIETVTLKASNSSGSLLSSMIKRDIEKTVEYVNERINDPVAPDLVYLRWRLPGQESFTDRQAVVYNFSYSLGRSPFFPPVSNHSTYPDLTLMIERGPFWERASSISTGVSNLFSYGGKGEVFLSYGTVPGRIDEFRVEGAASLTEYWVGFRTDKFGSKNNFEPVWSFDTVSTYNDATTSSSNSKDTGTVNTVVWTSGDTSMLERLRVRMSQVSAIASANRADQRGTFTVLLRARSTGTETFNVRLSDGFSPSTGDGNWNALSRVKISGTNFLFYPLGTVTIPPVGVRDTGWIRSLLAAYTLRLEIEVNTAGTGNFEATRFVLIPQDEGFAHVKGISTSLLVRNYIKNGPDGSWSSLTHWHTVGLVSTPTEFDIVNFFVPKDVWTIVFAGHHETNGQSLAATENSNVRIIHYPRYLLTGE